MRAEIISVGDEVLRGDVVNTNASFLSARLSELGFTVLHQCSVGDDEKDLLEVIRTAISRSHLTIFTGGLGPTDDDMTKETVAKAVGRKMLLDQETADSMRAWFASRGSVMTENNLKQAMIIEGCEILKNRHGTAPGIYLRQGNQALVLLPGPPRELEPLFYEEVRPRLEVFTDSKNHYITLHMFGIGESALEEAIKDLLYSKNPTAVCYAKTGEVEVRITGRGSTEQEALELATGLANKIKERVGSFVYSDTGDLLPDTVVKKLKSLNKRIAVAESCTGGLMASEITSVPGASEVFEYGISSYADWVKKRDLDVDRAIIDRYTAISAQTAAEMAKGVLNEGRADYGVGITGQAGPTLGSLSEKEIGLVYIAVADRESVTVKEFHFGDRRGRDFIRNLAVKNAFDMVRRILENQTIENARTFRHKDIADLTRENPKSKSALSIKRTLLSVLATLAAAAAIYFAFSRPTSLSPATTASVISSRVKIDSVKVTAEAKRIPDTLAEFAALNQDTFAMVSVPQSDLRSAVFKASDNQFYQTRDYEKKDNPFGSCFVDAGIDFSNENLSNTVIYGNGSEDTQLGFLQNYLNLAFLRENPALNLENLDGDTNEYKIVSVYYLDAKENPGWEQLYNRYFSFEDYDAFEDFVVSAKLHSIFETPTDIHSGDRFLTLVSGSDEWDGAKLVVVARELRQEEEIASDVSGYKRNAGAIYPAKWYEVNGLSPLADEEEQREKWSSWLKETDINAPEETEEPVKTINELKESEVAELIGTPPSNTGEGTGMNGPSGGGQSNPPPSSTETVPANPTPPSGGQITVTSASTGRQISGTPLDIVSMIVEAEVGSSFHPEAIKAQAVATITYLKYSYRSSSAPSVPLLSASQTVKNCVAEVINTGMFYNGSIIYSPYCSSMAGRSNACNEVWVQNLPYLVSVESKYDNQIRSYNRTYTWSKAEMKKILEEYYEITLSDTPENWIQVLDNTSGGYVGNMSIDGKYSTTGSRFRANCMYIRSAAFTHSYDPATETFTIMTSGYGHGVGMSQYGANFYAKNEGMSYQQILSHYYTGVSFGTVNW